MSGQERARTCGTPGSRKLSRPPKCGNYEKIRAKAQTVNFAAIAGMHFNEF